MRRKGSFIIAPALAVALFLLAPQALAHGTQGWGRGSYGPRGGGGYPEMWSHPQMLEFMGERIGLSAEQMEKLRGVVSEGWREIQRLQGDLSAARGDFRELMGESTLKEKETLAKVEEIGRLRAEILKAVVNMRLGAEKVLTAEQREALRDFILRGHWGRRGFYGHMGPWMHGGPGYGMGPGMMGPWMHRGPGYGMGPWMMGPWMHGGPGMMGPGMMGPWMHGGPGYGMGPWMMGPWMQGGPGFRMGPWMYGPQEEPETGPWMHRGPGMMGPSR